MEEQELAEAAEKARKPEQKQVGITMAIVAVLLAIATMLGHRAHTEEVLLQTRTNDQWGYYQAKNNRSEMYAADATLALLMKAEEGQSVAAEFAKRAEQQKTGAEDIRQSTERLEEETRIEAKRANYFDLAEVFLEATIVLCSITLLSGSLVYWKISFFSTAIGLLLSTVAVIR
jgi:siroheme synthase